MSMLPKEEENLIESVFGPKLSSEVIQREKNALFVELHRVAKQTAQLLSGYRDDAILVGQNEEIWGVVRRADKLVDAEEAGSPYDLEGDTLSQSDSLSDIPKSLAKP